MTYTSVSIQSPMSVKNEFLSGSPQTEAAALLCLENKTKDLNSRKVETDKFAQCLLSSSGFLQPHLV